jgi:hypothetical protein
MQTYHVLTKKQLRLPQIPLAQIPRLPRRAGPRRNVRSRSGIRQLQIRNRRV